jgi:hypothetical protein
MFYASVSATTYESKQENFKLFYIRVQIDLHFIANSFRMVFALYFRDLEYFLMKTVYI